MRAGTRPVPAGLCTSLPAEHNAEQGDEVTIVGLTDPVSRSDRSAQEGCERSQIMLPENGNAIRTLSFPEMVQLEHTCKNRSGQTMASERATPEGCFPADLPDETLDAVQAAVTHLAFNEE